MKIEQYGHPGNNVLRIETNGSFESASDGYGKQNELSFRITRTDAEFLRNALAAYLDKPPVRRWEVDVSPGRAFQMSDIGGDYLDGPTGTGTADKYYIWARTKNGALRRAKELHAARRDRAQAEQYDD